MPVVHDTLRIILKTSVLEYHSAALENVPVKVDIPHTTVTLHLVNIQHSLCYTSKIMTLILVLMKQTKCMAKLMDD